MLAYILVSKNSGTIFIDNVEVAQTTQCVHCDGHFIMRKGSGVERGYCMRCKGITCGKEMCWACNPVEKQLDLIDGG